MKTINFLLLSTITAVGCSTSPQNEKTDSISGTYVKKIEQEFAVGTDTLFIKPMDINSGKYIIVNASRYQQIIDGKLLSPKIETHKWIAIYDNKLMELTINNKEKTFHYLPKDKKLILGKSEYKKIVDD
jgi:hypothetical protein